MKQSIKELVNIALACTLPLWGWGTLAAVEKLKVESEEYVNVDNKSILVQKFRDNMFMDGEVRVMDKGIGGSNYSYLVDSNNDKKLDYRYTHAGGVNFLGGATRTKPTEVDQGLYDQLMGQ